MPRFKFLPAVFVLICACATASQTGEERSTEQAITRDEILASGAATAEEAIRQLRPEWPLNTGARGSVVVNRTGGMSRVSCTGLEPFIYEDTRRADRTLNQISVRQIMEIRFIRPYAPKPDGFDMCRNIPAIQVILMR